ncbi:AraC-like ligand-binding domain-containing protein [Kineococcus sp. SYSU DK001]|uniref:AraC-like ligand-binding domain-containing protein n=1 Tax=Kineococcus sp. SYSU DK001 TaxID=3383122 RepID=UPI003D7DC95F
MGGQTLQVVQADFDAWQQVVSNAFVPLSSSPLTTLDEPGGSLTLGWSGGLRSASLGTVQLSSVAGSAALVRRTASQISRQDPGYLKLGVQVAGCCVVEQDGREAALTPGDLALYDTSRPYQLAFEGPFEMLVVMFPRDLLRVPGGGLSQITARRVSGRRGVGAAMRPFLGALAQQLADDALHGSAVLSDAVLDLLAATVSEQLDCAPVVPVETHRHALFLRILTFIDARLDDPELTVPGIAAAHHVSLRYLQKLFEEEGRTVSGWLRERRLDRCRRDLLDPDLPHLAVSEVGARWGLSNPAAFARSFRSAYGVSPSEYRQQHAPRP